MFWFFFVIIIQWSTETGKYRNYRYRNFGMINRTETDNTEPKQMVYKPSKIAHILTFYCIFLTIFHIYCKILIKNRKKNILCFSDLNNLCQIINWAKKLVFFKGLFRFGISRSYRTGPNRTENTETPKFRYFRFGSVYHWFKFFLSNPIPNTNWKWARK